MIRIYVTSQIRIEHGEILIGERDLPGRQGRVVLALLVAERDRPVTRDELAEELWLDQPPPAWEKAVMALVSKLRATLRHAALGDAALTTSFGCYQLRLPADTWVDIEAAAESVHRAETALAAGDPQAAYPWAYVAYHVGRRPFLAGEDGPWVNRKRIQLREIHLRALDCTMECPAANGELAEALQAAEDALAIEPFRETTYQRLMRVHSAAGNRAEALRLPTLPHRAGRGARGAAIAGDPGGLHRHRAGLSSQPDANLQPTDDRHHRLHPPEPPATLRGETHESRQEPCPRGRPGVG